MNSNTNLKLRRGGANNAPAMMLKNPTTVIVIGVLAFVIILQWIGAMQSEDAYTQHIESSSLHRVAMSSSSSSSAYNNPLAVPEGHAVALPSIRIEETADKTALRKHYGGAGDKLHLGGFTDNLDLMGVSPAVWKYMIEYVGVKSILDVGCGKGTSTTWFYYHGVETLCVEGSHDAVSKNMHPEKATQVVEHDFSRGPWWPEKTYDAVWCVEFLEHVGRNFHHNYLPVFRKAAFIFVTFSTWGGWHHVEVHSHDWWITKMTTYGFVYDDAMSQKVRQIAKEERGTPSAAGKNYNAQHVYTKMLVFINPQVSARPEYARLMTQPGCSDGIGKNRKCGKGKEESIPPPEFDSLVLTPEMDRKWEKRVFGQTIDDVAVAQDINAA
eukprot:CAMPEP_0119546402 /NCGR_PEP_ID=MMETSP1352-20130426/840_1 /TAXON_ID=265584 /ORGANISM="Stauroneis constricta, Strain CCMP1120" /LENGTH=381 /DNA_ID=CAMNT_0007591107 /DNA_START=89 /DNA_END=1234 /DNA_ORIENTATION=+